MFNWPKLEQEFNEAIAGLPNYKRDSVIAYVAALRVKIKDQETEISELADTIIANMHEADAEREGKSNV